MGRRYQNFVTPGEEENELPIPKSEVALKRGALTLKPPFLGVAALKSQGLGDRV
jgi:hypothetical protein